MPADEKLDDDRFRRAAQRVHGRDGDVEIDENAAVSRGDDDGAYVQAWVWVDNEEARKK